MLQGNNFSTYIFNSLPQNFLELCPRKGHNGSKKFSFLGGSWGQLKIENFLHSENKKKNNVYMAWIFESMATKLSLFSSL